MASKQSVVGQKGLRWHETEYMQRRLTAPLDLTTDQTTCNLQRISIGILCARQELKFTRRHRRSRGEGPIVSLRPLSHLLKAEVFL